MPMQSQSNTHANRESWLSAAIVIFRGWFADQSLELPEVIRVSTGFPSSRALSAKHRRVGECWAPTASKDGSVHVFVSPVLGDALHVGDVLIHELCHAAAGHKCGHRGDFKRAATKMGLVGKMTATEPSPELKERLNAAIRKLGRYPHSILDPSASPVKKQSTRMLKAECGDCGYTIRVTRKWIEQSGLPTCPCGTEFTAEEPDDADED